MKRIYSLNLVSYLRSHGFNELSIERDESNNKLYYTFAETKDVQNAIEEYKNPNATVLLHQFISNFKDIKREIYEFNKN